MPNLGISKENIIIRGAARTRELVYLAMRDRKLHKKSIPHTRVGGIYQGQMTGAGDLTWEARGMCFVRKPTEKLITISSDGKVWTYVGGDETTEHIGGAKDLRACSAIDGFAFACGMHRQVFARKDEERWAAVHAPASKGNDVVGFEAIAGFDLKDIYAVGWQGEVWHYDGTTWTECFTPVNVILTSVICASDNQVYICGQSGTLLRGRTNRWDFLEIDGFTDDLWDLCWFGNKLYASSMSTVYELQNNQLVPVNFGNVLPDSCYKLTAADGVMWSIGQQSICSFDGKKWQQWD